MASCVDDNYMELDKGHDELKMSSTAEALVLKEENHSAEAIALTWTTGTNFGTGNKIYYTLEIAEAGKDFTGSYVAVDNKAQVNSWKKSVEELNTILRTFFGEKESYSLEARVTATVPDVESKQTSVVEFSVNTYVPVTSELYIFGDATKTGWSMDAAEKMARVDNGIFTWTGKLEGSDKGFKFAVKRDFIPTYNNDGNGNLVYRATYDEPDVLFTVPETGYYQVDVNLLTMKIKISESSVELPRFENLYFIGHEVGWSFVQMSKDLLDPFLFRYGRVFTKGGEFKFATTSGSWENNYKATSKNAPYTQSSVEFVSGFDPDNKWYLNDDELNKAYKICFDIRKNKERMLMSEFTPYEMIYLVGDASPAGWSIGNATPMTAGQDAYTFTWEGELKKGELKFTCDKKSDWSGAWFMASEANKAPTGEVERMLFIDKSSDDCKNQYLDVNVGSLDIKWKITEPGTYTIVLDQLAETVSITKK